MLAPSLCAAHASAMVSSILLATSGGVKTSSLERFAMQVSTLGCGPQREARLHPTHAEFLHCDGQVSLGWDEDLMLAELGEEVALFTERRRLSKYVEARVPPLELAFGQGSATERRRPAR